MLEFPFAPLASARKEGAAAAPRRRYSDILKGTPYDAATNDDGGGEEVEQHRVATAAAAAGLNHRRHCLLIDTVEVSVTSSDQSLNLETRESYSLEVAAPTAIIQANSVFGALRALETLAQLVRRRALAPGSPLAAAVPEDAVWPGECVWGAASLGLHAEYPLLACCPCTACLIACRPHRC